MSIDGVSLVLIGLNVERFLPDCLASVRSAHWPMDRLERIYVDSGSTDRSRAIVAAEPGWRVLELSDSKPSVAKGRNLGVAQANCRFVQFLDADMVLDPVWLAVATRLMLQDEHLAAVFGRTVERYPYRNIYHRMRHAVWSMHSIGESERLPGASLVRAAAFHECGIHRQNVRGFEDVELAHRFRAAGYRILGLPEVMCRHDSDMHSFAQYWKVNVRGGRGNYDILIQTGGAARMFFLRELRRSLLWPAVLLSGLVVAVALRQPLVVAMCLAGFLMAVIREVIRGWRRGGTLAHGISWSLHWVLSKAPYSLGFLDAYGRSRLWGRFLALLGLNR